MGLAKCWTQNFKTSSAWEHLNEWNIIIRQYGFKFTNSLLIVNSVCHWCELTPEPLLWLPVIYWQEIESTLVGSPSAAPPALTDPLTAVTEHRQNFSQVIFETANHKHVPVTTNSPVTVRNVNAVEIYALPWWINYLPQLKWSCSVPLWVFFILHEQKSSEDRFLKSWAHYASHFWSRFKMRERLWAVL